MYTSFSTLTDFNISKIFDQPSISGKTFFCFIIYIVIKAIENLNEIHKILGSVLILHINCEW